MSGIVPRSVQVMIINHLIFEIAHDSNAVRPTRPYPFTLAHVAHERRFIYILTYATLFAGVHTERV